MNQKKLVIGTAQFKPDGALEADFFTDAKKKLLDVCVASQRRKY